MSIEKKTDYREEKTSSEKKELSTENVEKKEDGNSGKELAEHQKEVLPVAQSMEINTQVLEKIKTELEKKLDTDTTEKVLAKIEELIPSTIAANIRHWGTTVHQLTGFLGKFGAVIPNKEIAGITKSIDQVAGVAEQITGVSDRFSEITEDVSNVASGLFGGGELETISGDTTIDAALQKLEEQMNQIKQQPGIDKAGHYAGVTVALSTFLQALEGHKDNETPDGGVDAGVAGATGVAAGVASGVEGSTSQDEIADEDLGDDDYDYDKNELLAEDIETNQYPIGMPVKGFTQSMVTSRMGPRKAPKKGASTNHQGIDIGIPTGTKILAPADGKVIGVKNQGEGVGAGLYIDVDHGSFITRYMHLSTQDVKEGDVVKKGQEIAKSGNTGNSSGPHLHYEIRYKGEIVDKSKKNAKKYRAVDPLHFIDMEGDGQVVAMNEYSLLENPPKNVA